MYIGDRGGTVVKVLRYKSEGRWFDSIGATQKMAPFQEEEGKRKHTKRTQ